MLYWTLNVGAPRTIVQVGAHAGDDRLIEIARRRGHRLYLFEPNPARVADLERKAGGAATIRVVPAAVSNYDGRAVFRIAFHDDCSSLQEFDPDANRTWVHEWHPYRRFETVDQVEVDVVRLDTFMAREGLARIDLLEIDAQGEDLRVVESLGDRLADVGRIQLEVNIHAAPLYQNSFGMADALAFFGAHGFDRHVWWTQSLNREANVIFRNRRWYPHASINAPAAFLEQHARRAYIAWQKLPRVLAVTMMMLRRRLAPRSGGRG